MKNEVPDSWIERLPEDDGPQIEDACMVCGKIECVCPSEQDDGYIEFGFKHQPL